MKIFAPICFLLILFSQEISGQTNAKINNVNFRLDNNKIIVDYNISGYSPGDRFTIGLKFISETNQVISPESLSGDIGKNIEAGNGKTIIWDFMADKFEFSGILKAEVDIIPSVLHARGPSYALLSVAVPGLGGYFVEEKKLRPIVTTVGTLGLLTFGIIEKGMSNRYYSDYKQSINYDDYNILYGKANSAHHKYLIATRLAVAAWIADIIWVWSQGKKNLNDSDSQFHSQAGNGFRIDYLNDELQLCYRCTF